MAYNQIHFKLIDEWKPVKKLNKSLPPRRTWCSPETLFIIAEITLRKHYVLQLSKDLFWPVIFKQLRSNEIVGICQYLISKKRANDVKFLNHWEKLTDLLDRKKNRIENKILVTNLRRRKNLSLIHPECIGRSGSSNRICEQNETVKDAVCRIELNSIPLFL